MTDYRAVAVENARQEFAPPTFREPEPCDVCGARIQLHERDGLMYDAEHTEAGPELHTCGPKLTGMQTHVARVGGSCVNRQRAGCIGKLVVQEVWYRPASGATLRRRRALICSKCGQAHGPA